MIATCSKCGNLISRYWDTEMRSPCEVCKSVLFFVKHIGYKFVPTHSILMNVETGEVLSDDSCDYYKNEEEK